MIMINLILSNGMPVISPKTFKCFEEGILLLPGQYIHIICKQSSPFCIYDICKLFKRM